jgi:2-(3-amino-3-carboxypropyl)histidine synthase
MIDLDRILSEIKARGCRTVGLQFPEGLKKKILGIADGLRKEGLEVVLVGDPCHGACDIASVPCDILVHLGHAPIKTGKNIIYEEVHIDGKMDVLEKCLPLLEAPVGLLTNVQHIHQLPAVRDYLERKNLTTKTGRGDERIKYDGQILGCNFSAASSIGKDVKTFLYFGSGDFHPLGVALATDREVVAADPFTREARSMNTQRDKFLRQRFAAIEASSSAESFGILVSGKFGQSRLNLAKGLADKIRKHGKKAYILQFDEVVPEYLEGYDLDCLVSTACPRIAIDDYMRFKKPIVTPVELEIILKERAWEDYTMDEILGERG